MHAHYNVRHHGMGSFVNRILPVHFRTVEDKGYLHWMEVRARTLGRGECVDLAPNKSS